MTRILLLEDDLSLVILSQIVYLRISIRMLPLVGVISHVPPSVERRTLMLPLPVFLLIANILLTKRDVNA